MPITDYYVTTDAMGSVMAVLDETGNVLERRSYDAFGEATYMLPDGTVVPQSATGVDIGFQGQLMDELTGMYQMGYRWYSPILGRWLSRDPIGLAGGVNSMAFVMNNPCSNWDPMGMILVDYSPASPLIIPTVIKREDRQGNSVTSFEEYNFECGCVCTKARYIVKCVISYSAKITLFENQFLVGPNADVVGIYGHEQRHILSEAERVLAKLVAPVAREPNILYDDRDKCLEAANEIKTKHWPEFEFLKTTANDGGDHVGDWNSTRVSPISGAYYPPLPRSPFPPK